MVRGIVLLSMGFKRFKLDPPRWDGFALHEVLFVFAGGSGRKRLIRRMSPILVNDL
ncbi:hypothetical protein [Rhizobium sp. FY34]|uniref:hypothetical protein n=1 Tax=Rhizobium sp. FY34 TaxID=2562309 RepID=UPI001484D247|nr:hypothetical protein [Rhizobium sp. FY34]